MEHTIKIGYGSELRRIKININEESRSLSNLKSKIDELFQLKSQNFSMRWTDSDGDEIIIATSDDLQEAVEFHSQTNSTLRIQITLSKNTVTPPSPQNFTAPPPPFNNTPASSSPQQTQAQQTIPEVDMLNQPSSIPTSTSTSHCPRREFRRHCRRGEWRQEEAERNGKPLHFRVVCDLCNGAIYGIRYKCSECEDFDMCEDCEAKDIHPKEHITMKIRVPARVQVMKPYVIQKFPMHHHRHHHQFHRHQHQDFDDIEHDNSRGSFCPRRRHHKFHDRSGDEETELPCQFQEESQPTPLPTQQQQQQQQPETQAQTSETIQPSTPIQPALTTESPQPRLSQLQQQQMEYMLQQLKDMGFGDEEFNRKLLLETRGELEEVIQRLFQL